MSVGHELPKSALDVARLFDGWVSRRSPMANSLWAKSGDESGYLSLTQHLVDVACAAAAVFDVWLAANVKRQLAKELGIEVEEVRTLYLWLAGVHDCGKATMTFQSQIEMTYPHIVNAVYDSGLTLEKPNLELKLPKMPHGISSGVLVSKWLQGQGLSALLARRIASTVDAHHGIASAAPKRVRFVSFSMVIPKRGRRFRMRSSPQWLTLSMFTLSWKSLERSALLRVA
ncbi:CRISPR-associated endonuclease Cas3'' [Corynebacterium renale]|uniref:CRISPR-associated endonuclease Cas3'' n=1 Tax=Corynebacterium renale TaxID=1724 RepID=UPI002162FF3E|nr:CRISPR-associated endonuclease Cas3'' [Corynebacterium renale]